MMMMRIHDNDRDHDNQHRQFPSSQRGEADGPTTTTTPRLPPRTNDIYDIVGSRIDHVFVSGGCSAPLQQPFHTPASTSTSIYSTAFNKSSGESMGFPFTNAQWKELERQAMIYKYMMASVPVPLDLLLPITNRNLCASSSPLVNGGELKLRFSNGADPEPGRCKRTDGKKWRCSRDVAPDQKYCERHMHRGRPRSRKHVELHVNNNNNNNNATSNKRTRLDHHHHNHQNSNNGSATTLSSSNFLGGSALLPYHSSPVFESLPSHLSSDKEPRSLEWMMKGGEHVPMATSSDPTWLHLMNNTKLEMTSKPSSMEEPFLNLNSYANFTTGEEHENDRDCALFLNPDNVVSDPPRSFIDAWSSQTQESNHQVKKLSPSSSSSLTLSMGNNNNDKSPSCSWLSPPLTSSCWVGSPLGGPLGEVLRPSTASDPPSPFTGNGDSGSPPATVASSPSGVLQKTLNAASLSDSSGCSSSSLALGSSNAKPEISLL